MNALRPELYQVVYEYCHFMSGKRPLNVYVMSIIHDLNESLTVTAKTTPDELKDHFRKWIKSNKGREKHVENYLRKKHLY